MSSVDRLLEDLAPQGVQFVAIAEMFELRNGYTPSKTNAEYWRGGEVPWFRMEDIRTNGQVLDHALQTIPMSAVKSGRLFPANSLLVATSATIGEHALVTVPHLSNQRFTSLSLKAQYKNDVDMRFAHYYAYVLDEWCLNNTTTSSFASVDMAGFKRFRFPVPPLEVQREIVRILDQFTQLEAELEAELEARRTQYQHYLKRLFDFSPVEVPHRPLAEVGAFRRGGGPQKKDFVATGVGCIHYGQIYTHYGASARTTNKRVDREVAAKSRLANPRDVIIAVTGENDDDLAMSVAWLGDDSVAVSNHTLIFTSEMDPRFVSYYLRSAHFDRAKRRYIVGTKVKDLPLKAFEAIRVPVPSIAEQERVANRLERLEALINDVSFGLPAEIAARRKQYEYYRDKLLSFKELPA